jgi:hypothetical protein
MPHDDNSLTLNVSGLLIEGIETCARARRVSFDECAVDLLLDALETKVAARRVLREADEYQTRVVDRLGLRDNSSALAAHPEQLRLFLSKKTRAKDEMCIGGAYRVAFECGFDLRLWFAIQEAIRRTPTNLVTRNGRIQVSAIRRWLLAHPEFVESVTRAGVADEVPSLLYADIPPPPRPAPPKKAKKEANAKTRTRWTRASILREFGVPR